MPDQTELDNLRKQYDPQIKAAYDKAVERGEISAEQDADTKKWYPNIYWRGQYQALWRKWCHFSGSGPRPEYNDADCMTAVLDALLNQGSMIVWCGDGTSCVTQMIQTAYEDRDYWRKRALEAEEDDGTNAQGHTQQIESD